MQFRSEIKALMAISIFRQQKKKEKKMHFNDLLSIKVDTSKMTWEIRVKIIPGKNDKVCL